MTDIITGNGSVSNTDTYYALEFGKKLLIASREMMKAEDRNMSLETYLFGVHWAAAGLVMVGFATSYNQIPSEASIEFLVGLYRNHLKSACLHYTQHPGPTN